jgi:hypothetical protein
MEEPIEKIQINLWKADAIVLFDWLMTVDMNVVPSTHRAEKQALTDLLTQLEQTDVADVTQEEIDKARDDASKDMGW